MIKDIEWLKEEIGTEMIQLEPNRKERWSDVKYQTLRNVAQKINQLDEPEVLSKEWIDENEVFIFVLDDDCEIRYVPSLKLRHLLVPEQEKVKIPYFIEEHIQSSLNYSEENTVVGKIENHMLPRIDETETDSRVLKFFNTTENIDLVALAMITENYEVEEEQKYYLKIGNLYLAEPLGDMTSDIVRMTRDKGVAYQFTDEKSIATHLDKFEGTEAVKVEELDS